jgi:hypothetical protein
MGRRAAEIRVSIDRLKNPGNRVLTLLTLKIPPLMTGTVFFMARGHFELPLGAKSSVSSVSKTKILNGSQWVKR